MQVLDRGIVFIDLAIAQVAALGVIVADYAGWSPTGVAVQIAALSAALLCAMLLTWTDHRWPQVQQAIIGVVFVIASSAAILVLAKNPHDWRLWLDLALASQGKARPAAARRALALNPHSVEIARISTFLGIGL